MRRIVLVRPAVEAGERLGFLPGDLSQKVDPYLRPMYDALYDMIGAERVTRLIERNVIEIAPLAFMRGRSLNESFVILDEAQNTSVEQMKMFLTRIGFGSRAVVTGDITQIDLPTGKESGLKNATDVLKNVRGVAFTYFTPKTLSGISWCNASFSLMSLRTARRYRPVTRLPSLLVDVQIACETTRTFPRGLPIEAWVTRAVDAAGRHSRAALRSRSALSMQKRCRL